MKPRQSMQRGYLSDPIATRHGPAYLIRWRVPTPGGSRHRSETLHGVTKKEARAILDQRVRECSTHPIEARELTFDQFVETYWRPYLDRKAIKPSTRHSYESGLRVHLAPALSQLLIAKISPLHIEELLRSKLSSGMSPKTARNLLGLVQSIFSLAVDNDLISRSPVRERHKPNVLRHEKPTWTPDQIKAIVGAVPEEYWPLFECIALTGARLGEILGLQWKYVDLEERKLEIRHTLWNGQLLPPKTEGSVRIIRFGPALTRALEAQRDRSKHIEADDLVFRKQDGTPLQPDVLRRDVLYPALDRLGISRSSRSAGFHRFRHSAGSIINEQTGNLKLAQKLLGHSNLSTTADIYTHTSAQAELAAVLSLERAIHGNLFQTVPETWNKNSSAAIN